MRPSGGALLLVTLLACARTRPATPETLRAALPPSARYSGVIVFGAPNADNLFLKLHWIDVASGATGATEYFEGTRAVHYVADRRGAWLADATRSLRETGALRVARAGTKVAARYVPDIALRGVSPDEQRAVVAVYVPASSIEYVPLVLASVTPTGFAKGEELGIDNAKTQLVAWSGDGGIVADRTTRDGERELVRVTAAAPASSPAAPVALRRLAPRDEYRLSHDGRTLASVAYDEPSDEFVVQLAPVSDPNATPRTVKLGRALEVHCDFAPGDAALACQLEQRADDGRSADIVVIDVATAAMTKLGTGYGRGIAFSPDGRAVVLSGPTMTIVPLDGKGAPVKLPIQGRPNAWIR